MKQFYCNGKKDFCDRHTQCTATEELPMCEFYDGSGGEEREVDESEPIPADKEKQDLVDLLIAREEIKDANAYDRAESLADYLLENGYRGQKEGNDEIQQVSPR